MVEIGVRYIIWWVLQLAAGALLFVYGFDAVFSNELHQILSGLAAMFFTISYTMITLEYKLIFPKLADKLKCKKCGLEYTNYTQNNSPRYCRDCGGEFKKIL